MNIRRKSLRLILWGFIFLAYFSPFKLSSISIFLLFTFKFYKSAIIGIAFISMIEFVFLLQSPIIVQNILTSANNYVLNNALTSVSITNNYVNFYFSFWDSINYMTIVILTYYITIIFACISFKFTLGKRILKRVSGLSI